MDPFRSKFFLKFTNQMPHPERRGYEIYHYKNIEEADYFESLLKEKNLFYERDEDQINGIPIYLFGVKSEDMDQVDTANYLAKGKFRANIVSNKFWRYALVLLGLALIAFAFLGYYLSNFEQP
jgi:hypothetical protein